MLQKLLTKTNNTRQNYSRWACEHLPRWSRDISRLAPSPSPIGHACLILVSSLCRIMVHWVWVGHFVVMHHGVHALLSLSTVHWALALTSLHFVSTLYTAMHVLQRPGYHSRRRRWRWHGSTAARSNSSSSSIRTTIWMSSTKTKEWVGVRKALVILLDAVLDDSYTSAFLNLLAQNPCQDGPTRKPSAQSRAPC